MIQKRVSRRLGSREEVAVILGASAELVDIMVEQGIMPPPIQLYLSKRFDLEQIHDWISQGCRPVCEEGKQ